ncbi:MAG: ABC transporter six-transmembrane domain-containing protein [Pseudomonadota bacterium]
MTTDVGPEAAAADTFWGLVRAHWGKLSVTTALFLGEASAMVAGPWALGHAIDGIIAGRFEAILPLVFIQIAFIGIGTARRMIDSRAYGKVYETLAARLVLRQRGEAVDRGVIAARTGLAQELVNYFERDSVATLHVIVSLFGALIMIAFYDLTLVAGCLGVLAITGFIQRDYMRRSLRLNRSVHDQMEGQVGVVMGADANAVSGHYAELTKRRVQLSDFQALHFGVMEILGLALLAGTLMRAGGLGSVTPGEILAAYRYVQMFTKSLSALPVLFGQVSRLQDINRRLFALR